MSEIPDLNAIHRRVQNARRDDRIAIAHVVHGDAPDLLDYIDALVDKLRLTHSMVHSLEKLAPFDAAGNISTALALLDAEVLPLLPKVSRVQA
jgi:hypothetical protein